ncbi:methyltransferase domain-containing protein [Streptomyces sp. NPDC026672]|uniref:methyltransferase domain-containing protein n=1 Tax=unclassified Streptomyces TaxID=2593676 RepID=UPI0033F7DE99
MIQIVEHAPQEGPYAVPTALEATGLPVRVCRTWAGEQVPETVDDIVALVMLGEPPGDRTDLVGHDAELALLRAALEAEVPVLGVSLGARLLALAAGGADGSGTGERVSPAVHPDPLFAAVPEGPAVRAFRVGGSAWGIEFPPEPAAVVEAVSPEPAAVAEPVAVVGSAVLAEPVVPAGAVARERQRGDVFARFAAYVVARAERTATRAFFTRRAATWEQRFAEDGPRYAAAVDRMGLRPGQRVLDVGCGTGRALPALRARVGDGGLAVGVDLTPAMLTAAVREGRDGKGQYLLLADACRLPLPAGAVDGVFSAGLVDHVPDPAAALREWARVTSPGGVLLLFHPSGRAERAARHGRPLDPADPLAEDNLTPALRAAGWDLARYEDASRHFLARAVRTGGG